MRGALVVVLLALSPGAVGAQRPAPESPSRPAAAPAEPDSAAMASAYLDPAARELVRAARARLSLVDRSVRAYRAMAAEKATVRVRALRRDRVLWSREVAARVDWAGDGTARIEVLGAREVLPPLLPEPQVPTGLDRYLPHLAFDPADPYVLRDWFDDGDETFNPLRAGSEANYRYRSGGSRAIRLPDGREIRLVELQIIPRRETSSLIDGSFWLDEATHSIVQATFRPAAPAELFQGGPLGSVEGTLDYVTIEFGLWDLKWWLPRIMAIRGTATASGVGSGSIVYERVYSDYEVDGLPETALRPAPPDSIADVRVCPSVVVIAVTSEDRERGRKGDDPSPAPPDPAGPPAAADSSGARSGDEDPCARIEVVLPPDSVDLAASELLSEAPFDAGGTLLTPEEIASIRQRVEDFALFIRPRPQLSFVGPLGEPGLLRYNRVEGLSAGVRAKVGAGPLHATATGRLGVADVEPSARVELRYDRPTMSIGLAGYRELTAINPEERPFSLGASASAFLFGNDDGDYLRTAGVELRGQPSLRFSRWYDWRLYAQRESPVAKETDFSLPHLFDDTRRFQPNAAAAGATQLGGALALRGSAGDDPLGLRLDGELAVNAATGTFRHVRPSLTLRAGFPLPGLFVGHLEAAGGLAFGELATQHLWRLGGPHTVRGYESGQLEGEAFWRGRAEIGTQLPMVRLVLFGDAGWAGARDATDLSPLLSSAGVGIGLLDGFFRLDLARALEKPTGWRLTAYLDAWL